MARLLPPALIENLCMTKRQERVPARRGCRPIRHWQVYLEAV